MPLDRSGQDEMRHDLVDIVGGVLWREDTILLGKRAASRRWYPNVWDVIGGHMEAHEQPLDALSRELQEEIGVTPAQSFLLESFDDPDLRQDGVNLFHLYIVTAWSGTPRNQQPHEHSEIRWFPIAQAVHLDLPHPIYPTLFQRIAQSVADH